jgi:hypothetical protein
LLCFLLCFFFESISLVLSFFGCPFGFH